MDDLLGKLDQTFTYDPLHRLASADGIGAQGYGLLGYEYDPAGNLVGKGPGTDASPADGRIRLHYERPAAGGPASVVAVDYHNVSSWIPDFGAFDYDADGGMIHRRVLFGSYDQPNGRDANGRIDYTKLPQTSGGNPIYATYHHDPEGARFERLEMAGGNVLTYRMYVDASFEADWVANTHEVHVFVGSRRVATSTRPGLGTTTTSSADAVRFFHSDHVGSNTLVTDAAGQVVQESFLTPFGEVHAMLDAAGQPLGSADDSVTPYLFTDQERDAETDLHYFGARYYDPWVGRFMSQDPELIGADIGITFARITRDPQNSNPYAYVLNRPTALIDPSGANAVPATPPPPEPPSPELPRGAYIEGPHLGTGTVGGSGGAGGRPSPSGGSPARLGGGA